MNWLRRAEPRFVAFAERFQAAQAQAEREAELKAIRAAKEGFEAMRNPPPQKETPPSSAR